MTSSMCVAQSRGASTYVTVTSAGYLRDSASPPFVRIVSRQRPGISRQCCLKPQCAKDGWEKDANQVRALEVWPGLYLRVGQPLAVYP
jgi:hypothetical protein